MKGGGGSNPNPELLRNFSKNLSLEEKVTHTCPTTQGERLNFFGQSQIIFIVMRKRKLYMVFICIISVFMDGNARESPKKSCFLKTLLFVLLLEKYYSKPKMIKTYCISFFCTKNLPSVVVPVLAFFGRKSIFFIFMGHQSSPQKTIM